LSSSIIGPSFFGLANQHFVSYAIAEIMLYFDHNATTPLLPEARQAWLEAVEQFPGNPSSPHRTGTRADGALQSARERLARILDCDPLEIIWTSGATESNNTLLHHLARNLPGHSEIWVSSLEHPCVLEPAKHYFPKTCKLIPATHAGVVDLDWLQMQLRTARPGLIAVMAANNETGVLQPWREVLALGREHGIPLLCDAAQWLGKLPATGLGQCDFLTGCAHKFGGPKGVGFMKIPLQVNLQPLLLGGKQEDGRRAGTENVASVLAMLAAVEHREQLLAKNEHQPRLRWREEFAAALLEKLPGAKIVGANAKRLWNTVSAVMPDGGCQPRWVVRLDKFGFAVSTGSACASGREEPSHVLAAMGYPPSSAGRVLRFSSGWETIPEDWQQLLDGLVKTRDSFRQ
jgi:cysteine desulfurase